MIESYKYDAFGAPTTTYSAGNFNNRFKFTGREYQPNFGIYEYRNRAYHPGLGRFMSEDPKGFEAGDYNLFRYCANDPEDKTDPMGTYAIDQGIPERLREKLNRAQEAGADAAHRASVAIDNALAGRAGHSETIAAFQQRFGVLSATPNKMAAMSAQLKLAETALRDDGSKGYTMKATTIAELTKLGKRNPETIVGIGQLPGKIISINLEHFAVDSQKVLNNTVPHESLHNAGLRDISSGDFTAYSSSGKKGDLDLFKSLPRNNPAGALNNVDSVRAFMESIK